jgi:glycogen operon protein
MDESFLILVNAHHEPIDFHLPSFHGGFGWLTLLDTTREQGLPPNGRFPTTSPYRLTGRSFALLQEVREKS